MLVHTQEVRKVTQDDIRSELRDGAIASTFSRKTVAPEKSFHASTIVAENSSLPTPIVSVVFT
jgi:hypothetical protein